MRYRDRINAEIMGSVQDALSRADVGDVSSLEAIYGANAAAGVVAAARASGASAHAQEIAYQTARGLSEIIDRQNIALAERAERVWYEVTGDAITATNHGLKPRDKVVAEAVAKLAAAGIDTIDYKSGIHSQLDVAVRRHLVSQTSQAGGEMTLARLNQYGHTLVRVSAHYGARPTHDVWQGKAYSLNGRKTIDGITYDDFYAATEYGSVGGLKGVNCRHSFGPYYPGLTTLQDLDFPRESSHFGMTSEQYYDATQRQRELERRVRKTKREIAALERAGLGLESPSYVQKRLLLGKQQSTLREHVADSRLERQYAREKAYGVGAQPRALRSSVRWKRPDIVTGRSLGAAAARDDVTIPQSLTGMSHPIMAQLAEGRRVTSITPIAGRGCKTPIKGEMESLQKQYPDAPASAWIKMAGKGYIEDLGIARKVELHWYECEQVGRVRMKVKRYL